MFIHKIYKKDTSTNIKTSLNTAALAFDSIKNLGTDLNPATLAAYNTQLSGLTATQQKMALSTTNLTLAQQKQVLSYIAETAAAKSLTAQQITELSIDQKQALIKAGLITQEQIETGVTLELSKAQLQKIITSDAISTKDKELILGALGVTGANLSETSSWEVLGASIKKTTAAMLKWLFLTPAGWATLAITAIAGTIVAYNKWGDTLENNRKKLEELKSEAQTISSDLQTFNSELQTTQQRISELESKGNLTFTEAEELENLRKQNNELQRSIDLLRLKEKENNKGKNKTFVKTMQKNVDVEDERVQTGRLNLDDTAETEMITEAELIERKFNTLDELQEKLRHASTETEKKAIQEQIDKITKYLSECNEQYIEDAEGIDYIQNPTTKDDEKVNEWLDYINDFQDKMAIAMGGDNAKENAFNRLVDNWKFDEVLNPLQKLGKEGKVTLEELKKRMNDPVFVEFVNKLKDIGFISDTTDGSLRFLANTFNNTIPSAKEYLSTFDKIDSLSLDNEEAVNNFIESFQNEAKAIGTTTDELAKLTSEHLILNNTTLSLEDKEAALRALGETSAWAKSQVSELIALMNQAAGAYSVENPHDIRDGDRSGSAQLALHTLFGRWKKVDTNVDNDTPPYSPSGGDKGSGKDNTPDYEDPTEAIINRINLRADELAQQEESIQNAIEIAELENDYKKQISLTNDLIAKRKDRLAELETANTGLHNEAEYLRNSNPWDEAGWFDSQGNATKAYYDLYNSSSKEEQERIKDLFEKLSKYKKAYTDNSKEISEINKENLQDEEKIWDIRRDEFDARMEESEYYIQHSKDFGWKNGDNEIAARKRVLEWIQSDYYKSLIKDDVEYYKILEENRLKYIDAVKDEVNKILDLNKSRIESQKTLLQSHYDVSNSVAEAQHEINKELKASLTMSEWLDESTRKLLFNQKDYNILSDKLVDIQAEADKLQRKYNQDILSATADNLDEITSKYQMQYDLMMKQYEIAKAELEVAKKRQQLDNVLNERNVRMFIDGQWQWVADTQNVIDAQNELADAKFEAQQALVHKEQTESMNELTAASDRFATIVNEIDSGAIDLRDGIGDITSSLNRVATETVPALRDVINSTKSALQSFSSSAYSGSSSTGSSGSSYSSGRVLQVGSDGNAPDGATIGDIIQTAGGNYKVVAAGTSGATYNPASGLYSIKVGTVSSGSSSGSSSSSNRSAISANKSGININTVYIKQKKAKGTGYTQSGSMLAGENGEEIYIDSNGHLIPVVQPTIFKDIEAGGKVFNGMQMRNLESLWNLSNVGFNHSLPTMVERNQSVSTIDNSIHINGMTISEQGNEDWISGLKRYVYTHKGSM